MTTDFRTLCAELSFIWNRSINPDDLFENLILLIPSVRAALAEQPVPVSERLQQMEDLAADAVAGLRYIEQSHGRLYGVGWDRVYEKADRLKPAPEILAIATELEGQ